LRAAEKELRVYQKKLNQTQKAAHAARLRCDDFDEKKQMKDRDLKEKCAVQEEM